MKIFSTRSSRRFLLVLVWSVNLAGCAGQAERDKTAALPEFHATGRMAGYLPPEALPDSRALLPPAPAADSAAFALDEEYSKKSFALRDSPAWALAALDADLSFPNAAGTFSCALNAPVTRQDTPHLYTLLQRTLSDAGLSTKAAKQYYQRPRPFMVNHAPICSTGEREKLEKSGSYPSGHNAAGMTWALILAEISPHQADAILARGRAFGISRVVCNVHWRSDTQQGRYMGAYTVARLHADPGFRADLEAARAELEAVRAQGFKPIRDCQAEAAGVESQRALDR